MVFGNLAIGTAMQEDPDVVSTDLPLRLLVRASPGRLTRRTRLRLQDVLGRWFARLTAIR